MRPTLWALWILLVALTARGQGIAPKLVVPQCEQPPVVDGEIGKAEWRHAAAVTGFKDHSTGQLDPRQVVAFITYDATHLYLAFNLPIYPKGAALIADHTTRDTGNWSGDDILELLLDPFAGKYKNEESYFQFMGNPAGAIILDQAETPALGLYGRMEWNGRWNFKNKVASDRWQAELSIPLADLGLKEIPDGAKWLVHFSRTWGVKVGWTTLSPIAGVLNTPGGGGELTFRTNAPAVRLLSVAPLLNGRVGFSGEIANGNEERECTIEALVVSEGKEIVSKKLSVHLRAAEVIPFSLDEPAALSETNVFHLRIASGDMVWQEVSVPFLKSPVLPVFPQAVQRKFVLEARYLPTFEKIWIDKIDFGNFPDQEKVAKLELAIFRGDEWRGHAMVRKPGTLLKDIAFPTRGLVRKAGDYRLVVSLLGGDGRVLASEETTFHQQRFRWSNSQAGQTDAVLPPFVPITVRGKAVSVLGRDYLLNDLALFDQILAEQHEPTLGRTVEPLLHAPLSVYSLDGGKMLPASPLGKSKATSNRAQHAEFAARAQLGSIRLHITNRIEYDGVAWIEIELLPRKPTRVGDLIFDIPMREDQATLLHEITDAVRRTYAGVTPPGSGTVWDSRRLLNTCGTLGNFKPMYWLGNEDRGLCWFAESDRGWHLDEERPAIEVVREPGAVILRMHLINKPLLLDKPRKICFGLQATPVKPLPLGWRGWVAPYSAAEQKKLTYFNFSPVGMQIPTYAARSTAPYPDDYAKAKDAMDRLRRMGCIPFLYEAMQGLTADHPETQAYQGEWQRASYIGAKSFADFRAWHLAEYLKRTGFFTFYEDNAYLLPLKDPALGLGYARPDGQYQGEFPIRKMRDYLRREAAIYHELGMPNYLAVHKSTTMMPPCYSFATIAIDGEQRFMTTPQTDYIDQFPLDYIRAHIMGRQFGFVPFFLSEIKLGQGKDIAVKAGTRSEFALLLLHEIISWPAYDLDPETVMQADRAKAEFDLGAADVVFHPYWEKDTVVRTDSKDVVVSLWSRPEKAMALVANLGDAKQTTMTMDLHKLGFAPRLLKEFEGGHTLQFTNGAFTVNLPRHDYRLIWIE